MSKCYFFYFSEVNKTEQYNVPLNNCSDHKNKNNNKKIQKQLDTLKNPIEDLKIDFNKYPLSNDLSDDDSSHGKLKCVLTISY